jgi:hypothetical protein
MMNHNAGRNHVITVNIAHQLRDSLVLRALQSGKRFVSTVAYETKLTKKQVIASLDRLARQNFVTVDAELNTKVTDWTWRAK